MQRVCTVGEGGEHERSEAKRSRRMMRSTAQGRGTQGAAKGAAQSTAQGAAQSASPVHLGASASRRRRPHAGRASSSGRGRRRDRRSPGEASSGKKAREQRLAATDWAHRYPPYNTARAAIV
eukprot:4221225-Pleurochrysis_carterae.AAC.2